MFEDVTTYDTLSLREMSELQHRLDTGYMRSVNVYGDYADITNELFEVFEVVDVKFLERF